MDREHYFHEIFVKVTTGNVFSKKILNEESWRPLNSLFQIGLPEGCFEANSA